jgi:hypothetical protein
MTALQRRWFERRGYEYLESGNERDALLGALFLRIVELERELERCAGVAA